MKEFPPLLTPLSSIYPSYAHPFSPALSHPQQPSSFFFSSSSCNSSAQAIMRGLDDEEEEDDENGYFSGLARRIVCSMLDQEEDEAFASDEDNRLHSPNTQGEVPIELGMPKKGSPDYSNSLLYLPFSLSPPYAAEEEAVAVLSLNAKEPQPMHKNLKKKKQKRKKGKQGKQLPTAEDEELIIHDSKGGAYEGRACHSSKRESWKDYRSPPAFSMYTLINRFNGGGSTSSSGGTGVFLPRSYTPCTNTTQTRALSACSTTCQAWPCLVSPPSEKETILPSLSYATIAAGSRVHDIDWMPPPFPSPSSYCSPLEHITADISLPMEWTY